MTASDLEVLLNVLERLLLDYRNKNLHNCYCELKYAYEKIKTRPDHRIPIMGYIECVREPL
jgi:hypothetical protein